MKKSLVLMFCILGISGCAANYQGFPNLIGETGTTNLYTARGFTDPNSSDETALNKYPEELVAWYCKKGGRVNKVEIGALRNILGQVEWTAIIECNKK